MSPTFQIRKNSMLGPIIGHVYPDGKVIIEPRPDDLHSFQAADPEHPETLELLGDIAKLFGISYHSIYFIPC